MAGLLGVAQATLAHKKMSDFIYRESQDEYYLHHQRSFESDQRQVTEIRMVKATGETTEMRLESAVDRRDRDKLQVIVSDISNRKQAEKELQLYAHDLERANQALRDFSSIVSHDLQEPLRKVKAFGLLLEKHYRDQLVGDGIDYLDRMKSAADRMESMLQGLRAYSQVSSQDLSVKPVDLGKIAAEVLTDLEARVMETGGKVVIEELPTISADPMQMRQLFQNLFSNALKYHRLGEPPLVSVTSRALEQDQMVIMVKDNGIGIDLQNAEHIFKPYTRLGDKSTKDGTGMGLAICKKIVERHGGTISVASVLEQGTTFTIVLPI
jgi:light-regulated signal transduction histidine kinase (bacteriophytochrome)